jgi:hypothetical protein
VVDVVRQLGIEIAERIVGKRGEVDDGVDALQVVAGRVAQISPQGRDSRHRPEKIAPIVEAGVHPDDVVPRALQHRNHDRSDEAGMAGDENSHAVFPLLFSRSRKHGCSAAVLPGPRSRVALRR